MATSQQIEAAKAELERRKQVEAAKAELASRQAVEPTPPQERSTFGMPTIRGVMQPTISMMSSQAADALGGLAGLGQIPLHALGLSDTHPAQVVKQYQEGLTYQPTDPRAQAVQQGQAEMLAPVVEAIDKTRTGEQTFNTTGSPTLATLNQIAPDAIMGMFGIKGLSGNYNIQPPMRGVAASTPVPLMRAMNPPKPKLTNDPLRMDLANQRPTARAAGRRLTPEGVVKVKPAQTAVKAGWSPDFVSWAQQATPQNKGAIRQMINITRRRVGEGKDFAFDGRPIDIAGAKLNDRVKLLRQVQKQSGQLVDKVARSSLRGKQVDISPVKTRLEQKIAELGGTFNEKGKLVFNVESKLYGQPAKQKALRTVVEKLESLDNVTDGYTAHELKQFITEFVDYGKAGKEGLSASVEKILKDIRADLNQTLKGQSQPYDKVNTAYSETTDALSSLQKAVGNSVDMFGETADTAFGTALGRLLTNYGSRPRLQAAVEQSTQTATKYGGQYNDDLTALVKAANEFEKQFGVFAERSLPGAVGQAGQRLMENPSVTQAGIEVVKMSARQLEKIRRSETARLAALEKLLSM